jgi:7-cyano-7-deazaguanine reductase
MVYARYTRRGGLDINPLRTTDAQVELIPARLVRQ